MNSEKSTDRRKMRENKLYQIKIMGEIDQSRKDWFEKLGFVVSYSENAESSVTILTGLVIDQSHLRGFLNKLWDLNLEVIQMTRLDTISR